MGAAFARSLPAGVLLAAVACSGEDASSGAARCSASVSGTVTGSPALPADAVVTVQIRDTSLQDVPAAVIGEQVIAAPGPSPIPYDVCYEPREIDQRHTYTMSVRITGAGGRLLYINDTSIPVISRGNPNAGVAVPVVQV